MDNRAYKLQRAKAGGKTVAAALLTIGLLSCVASRPAAALDAERAMIGMSKDRIHECMGKPQSASMGPGAELWVYRSANRAKSPNRCEVDLTFENGMVGKAAFGGDTGATMTKNGACGFLVKKCLP